MRVSCEVIKDLLPLYYDGVCSDESRKLVEEHLLSCNECKNMLKNMDKSLEIKYAYCEDEEVLDLKKLSKVWNKKLLWSMVKGAIYASVVIIITLLIISIFIGIKVG